MSSLPLTNAGQLTLNAICKLHAQALNDATARLAKRGYPLNAIQHLFDEGSDEEFVTCAGEGYHLEKAITSEGRFEIKATPGKFVGSNTGFRKWVDKTWTPSA